MQRRSKGGSRLAGRAPRGGRGWRPGRLPNFSPSSDVGCWPPPPPPPHRPPAIKSAQRHRCVLAPRNEGEEGRAARGLGADGGPRAKRSNDRWWGYTPIDGAPAARPAGPPRPPVPHQDGGAAWGDRQSRCQETARARGRRQCAPPTNPRPVPPPRPAHLVGGRGPGLHGAGLLGGNDGLGSDGGGSAEGLHGGR
jgi:hypothetical protein